MEGSDAQLRAVLPCIAGHAVLQVLGLGAYPALLQEDSAVPAMWHSGPWGGRAGEVQCPTHGNTVPLRCTSCTGKHPAWVRWCPEAVKARGAAREAYHFRPRTFELVSQQQQQQREQQQKIQHTFQGVPTLEEAGDGFQEVRRRKRPRGRPPGTVAGQGEAGRDPRQGKLTFAVRDGTGLTGGQGSAANQGATAGLVATATPGTTGEDVGMQGA